MNVRRQPEVNIGMVGHVDHGKTTLTKTLTGEWTDKHSEEIKRGISIKLGYADAYIYKCENCNEPECYSVSPVCKICNAETKFIRAVSFVDAPGHETLMATMLCGAALMDGALLLIAANEDCPQPQTKEHLLGLEISGINKIVVVQNKIDLVSKEEALKNYEQIKEFLNETSIKDASIIPISAHHDANIDVLIYMIEKIIETPERDESKPFRMNIARSFDVNKPGVDYKDIVGGILGGSLIQGRLNVGDEIEILPGVENKNEPTTSEVVGLMTGGRKVESVYPGGLVAVETKLDPFYTKADHLVGRVLGKPGTLPDVLDNFILEVHLLERVVGMLKDVKVEKLRTNEPLMLNVGVATTVGIVTSAREDFSDIRLKIPVCAEENQRVAISRRVFGRWRLIGYGIIK